MVPIFWIFELGITLYLAGMSLYARHLWPFPYVAALLFGFASGVMLASFPRPVQDVFWVSWLAYALALPLFKLAGMRERRAVPR